VQYQHLTAQNLIFIQRSGAGTGLTTENFNPLSGELTRIFHVQDENPINQFSYGYDHRGNVSTLETVEDGMADIATYRYNAFAELISVSDPGVSSENYQYDSGGNRTGVMVAPENRMTQDATYHYTYDNEGNLITRTSLASGETAVYSWDNRNRLTSIVFRNGSGTVINQITYQYDPLDRLIARTVGLGGGTSTEHYVYDGAQVLFVLDTYDHLVQRLMYGPGTDQMLAVETAASGAVYWAMADQLGSVRALANANGNAVNQLRYDGFGNIIELTDPNLLPLSTYTGRQWDADAGLYQYRARWYDPKMGRFISTDSAGFVTTLNLYEYTANNPVNAVDPSGHELITLTIIAAGIILGAAYGGASAYDATGSVGWGIAGAVVGGAFAVTLPGALGAIGMAAGEAVPWYLSGGRPDPTATAIGGMIGGVVGGSAVSFLQAAGRQCVTRMAALRSAGIVAGWEVGGGVVGAGVAWAASLDPPMGAQIGMLAGAFGGGLYTSRRLGSCFATGTPMRTPDGWKPIEQFRKGDLILSRAENDPDGPLEAQRVEEVFVGTARILHLHVGGHVIRTTAEHPFFAYDRGWVAAGVLRVGDWVASHDGSWTAVEDLLDTGEWETVYNLRVSAYHTYFVGGEDWGFSVWAHNACVAPAGAKAGVDYGEYAGVAWHHVHAKAAWLIKGTLDVVKGYTYSIGRGFAISKSYMLSRGWDHAAMTDYQRTAFAALGASGKPNTMAAQSRIARDALMAGGVPLDEANWFLRESLRNLRAQGVTEPARIPWN
jgi:RHS repeat-associated protein